MSVTRRHFLSAAAALVFAPAVAPATGFDFDVAIVGGGVSGAYAAWRLRQERPNLRVRLFEASERIGGRLHSVSFPQAPHLVAEAGGMRFLEAHRHVSGLSRHLGLAARETVGVANHRLFDHLHRPAPDLDTDDDNRRNDPAPSLCSVAPASGMGTTPSLPISAHNAIPQGARCTRYSAVSEWRVIRPEHPMANQERSVNAARPGRADLGILQA